MSDIMIDIEYNILNGIRDNLSCGALDVIMKGISFLAEAGWFWIVLGLVLTFVPKTRKIGVTVMCALVLSVLICNITVKPIVQRIRPFDLREGIELIVSRPTDYSFPSGHSSASFAAAAAIFAHKKKWGAAALILACLIGFSRLYLYVHFPTDVLGGAALGCICGVCGYYIVKYAYPKAEALLAARKSK